MKKFKVKIEGIIYIEDEEELDMVWLKIAKHFLDLAVENVDAESQFDESEVEIKKIKQKQDAI
jgi:hypothetical protein